MTDEKSLRGLLEQIFADGVVEPKEREALAAARAGLQPADVLKVFVKFLSDKWGEVTADGRITGTERALLIRVVDELNLSADELPVEARMALGRDLA